MYSPWILRWTWAIRLWFQKLRKCGGSDSMILTYIFWPQKIVQELSAGPETNTNPLSALVPKPQCSRYQKASAIGIVGLHCGIEHASMCHDPCDRLRHLKSNVILSNVNHPQIEHFYGWKPRHLCLVCRIHTAWITRPLWEYRCCLVPPWNNSMGASAPFEDDGNIMEHDGQILQNQVQWWKDIISCHITVWIKLLKKHSNTHPKQWHGVNFDQMICKLSAAFFPPRSHGNPIATRLRPRVHGEPWNNLDLWMAIPSNIQHPLETMVL